MIAGHLHNAQDEAVVAQWQAADAAHQAGGTNAPTPSTMQRPLGSGGIAALPYDNSVKLPGMKGWVHWFFCVEVYTRARILSAVAWGVILTAFILEVVECDCVPGWQIVTISIVIFILVLEFPYLFDKMENRCTLCGQCCHYTALVMTIFKYGIVRGLIFAGFTAVLFCTKDELTRVGAIILGVSALFYIISFLAGEDKHPERRSALTKKQFALLQAAKAAEASKAAEDGGIPSHPLER